MDEIICGDNIATMKKMKDSCINLTLTDIPYNEVNRSSNGLRNMDKGDADVLTFDLNDFMESVYRVTKNTIIVFCGNEQYSDIYSFFAQKGKKHGGTVRQIIWEKSNPSPMNGQYVYLSGTENAVWFKKRGGTFNAHCKRNVFKHPCGRAKLHPTEKNHNLLNELILDNSNVGDIVFDPCSGSGAHLFTAKKLGRRYIGIDISEEYCELARERIRLIKDE